MSNKAIPIKEFRLELSDLTYTGHDLVRPESVQAQPDGTLWTSDGRGGVTRINPGGSQQFIAGLGIITPDGDYHVVIEDPREEVLKSFEEKVANGTAQPNDMLMAAGPNLQFITSLAFGGPDLRTAYLGSLAMSTLPTFQSPVPGLPMSHWKK